MTQASKCYDLPVKPTRQDVEELVVALFTVHAGMERARRNQHAAGTLAVLQIAARGRVHPSVIAAELGIHQSSVTRRVQALVEAGLVSVVPDQADGRARYVVLTDSGRDEVTRLTEVGMQRFASFVADWDADDVRTLSRLLTRFEQAKHAADPAETAEHAGPPEAPRGRVDRTDQ